MMYVRPSAYRVGDPGIFGAIGKVIGGVAKTAVSFVTGGPIAAARTAVGQVVTQLAPSARPGGAAAPVLRLTGPSGSVGNLNFAGPQLTLGGGARPRGFGRRMNPGNAKAARRAIRRIKSVRKMLKSIEGQMPRRPCACKVKRGR